MKQSISHWGQFEMQAPGTENFKEHIVRVPKVRTSHHRNAEESARLQALVDKRCLPTSFFVSRQDTTYQTRNFGPELK